MASIYDDTAVVNNVRESFVKRWNLLTSVEQTAILTIVNGGRNLEINVILGWNNFDDYTQQKVLQKALQAKVKAMFNSEAKKLNKQFAQTTYAEQVDKKADSKNKRVKKLYVPINLSTPYANDNWNLGVTKWALALVRVGLASFSSVSSCFVYYSEDEHTHVVTNYVAKLVNGDAGTKVIKYVSI